MIDYMDWHKQNIKVYDNSASELAERFNGIGSRIEDIERALKLANQNTGAKVVEIGCGDGRDAVEIIKRATTYQGFDPSAGLLDIARYRVPEASFVLSDTYTYEYPDNLDVIYAFASLLHVNRNDLRVVFNKAHKSLRHDGIFYISLKERDSYGEETKTDIYGVRMFYYYNPEIIKQMANKKFTVVYEEHYLKGKTNWFTIALKKI